MKPLEAVLPELTSLELHAAGGVAEHGSFMAAALTLGMSQPALTRAVQRLERAVGAELFRRTTRRVEVTPAGEAFLAVARRVLDEHERIVLSGEDKRVFLDALLNPPEPADKLVAAFRRHRQIAS